MSLLTNLTQAQIDSSQAELNGKILTRPALLVTDGAALIYAVDVDIGLGAPLKNVPIAAGNRELIYAEVGNAARLRRSDSGQYEVAGFSKELPGTFIRVCVHIGDGALGPVTDETIHGEVVSLGALADFGGGFGFTPFEAVAIYRGDTLLELRI